LNLLVGTFLTTAMLILSTGVRDKVAVSLPALALPHLMTSSALPLPVHVSKLVVVVVVALLMLVPTTASGSIPVTVTIVTMKMPIPMLDFPLSKASEETLVPSALLVPLTPRVLDLKPLSASSIPAADLVAAPNLLLTSTVSPLSVKLRVSNLLPVTLVPLIAPIPTNIVALLVERSALEDVWVEVLVLTVSAVVTMVTRVRIVLLRLNK